MLPELEEIEKWTIDKLQFIIRSGESCYWNIKLDGETQDEVDYYVENLYSELEKKAPIEGRLL